jgi:hypothetical protein
MQESNHRSPLLEQILQPGDSSARDHPDINKLCDVIRETSFEIHKFLRSGHLEKIYENAELTFPFCAFCAFLWLESYGLH